LAEFEETVRRSGGRGAQRRARRHGAGRN
jgi:ribosomal protein L25 (general stress protein Ctc)